MAIADDALDTSLDTRALLGALVALKKGDFTVRLPVEWTGLPGKVADTFNECRRAEPTAGQRAGSDQPRRRQRRENRRAGIRSAK